MKVHIAMLVLLLTPTCARASGHGPLFGGATPTLGKGGWQFDQAWMVDSVKDDGSGGQVLRSMIGVGLTEHVQLSLSAPIGLVDLSVPPSGRMMSSMSFNRDVELLAGWRFHSRPVGHGGRLESTIFAGGSLPITEKAAGLNTAPAAYVSVASGYASLSHYVWVGASRNQATTSDGDRIGSVTTITAVYGYRPAILRLEYPRPDLRFFVESVSDWTGQARHGSAPLVDSGGRITLVGPSFLLLYKAYGLGGGILFPVFQSLNGAQASERFRFGVNFAYFFWPSHGKAHQQ